MEVPLEAFVMFYYLLITLNFYKFIYSKQFKSK
ncbi:DUF1196 domain-containing protein [Vibrio anguillarum]|nr:DUF1196 domain-containing protein [Vibrio anguillarum]AXM52674.1 DUF1196 domain-containing protein [Vibrio anguillarum]AXM55957.1 DUF1196 domain-containing protein [Vibrio anguillarum]AXM58428.1 DUF1196 domain-containing protein [Vibrio anguillarum]AXM62558.1 DUF1196 domain-containing protein [Vibrio anguillarum]